MNTCRIDRLDRDRARPDLAVVGRHVAPAEQLLPFFGDDLLEEARTGSRLLASRGRNTSPTP